MVKGGCSLVEALRVPRVQESELLQIEMLEEFVTKDAHERAPESKRGVCDRAGGTGGYNHACPEGCRPNGGETWKKLLSS